MSIIQVSILHPSITYGNVRFDFDNIPTLEEINSVKLVAENMKLPVETKRSSTEPCKHQNTERVMTPTRPTFLKCKDCPAVATLTVVEGKELPEWKVPVSK